MTEKTIAKFKYENSTYKLLEITNYDPKIEGKKEYLIVKNRKRLAWSIWEEVAKQKFASIIAGELQQTNIFQNIYKCQKGGKFYIEDKEITKLQYQNICYNNIHNIGTPTHIDYDQKTKRFLILKEITYEEFKQHT